MLSTWIAAALIVALSLPVGRAVTRIAGRSSWCGLEPAAGLAAILAVEGILARIPVGRNGLILALLVLVGASLWILRRPGRADLPRWTVGLTVTLAVAFLLVNVPFAVTGHWGLLGVGYNNDLGLHLAWADWLRRGIGTEPGSGYPLGPHGLAAALASVPRLNLATVFTGQLIAIVMITAWTAWGAVGRLGGWKRPLAAVLVAAPYLMVSFYAQAAFKELAMALFLLAFVIAAGRSLGLDPDSEGDAGPRPGRREAAVPLVLAAGIVFTYSFPGLVWPLAVLAAAAIAVPAGRARLHPAAIAGALRRPAVSLAALAGLALLAVLVFAGPFGFGSDFSEVSASDAFGPVSPLESLGVWLDPDYRLDGVTATPLPVLLGAIALLSLALALSWWLRRPPSVWPAALLACAAVYLASLPWMGDYSLAKALVVSAPIVMVVVLVALLSGPERSRARPPGFAGWTALTALFVAGASLSSLLVLRDASVAPAGHSSQLARLAPRVAGNAVLFLGQDRFAQWHLSGARVGVPLAEFPDPDVTENPKKPFQGHYGQTPIDFDSFDPDTFGNFRYAITTSAGWQSATPPFYREVDRTPDYILWEKTGPAFGRPIMREHSMPAKLVDCESEGGRYFHGLDGRAVLMPDTEVIYGDQWTPDDRLKAGEEASAALTLGPGTWRVSLQYFSPFGLRLAAPGYDRRFPASLDGQRLANRDTGSTGQYWPGGLLKVKRRGTVTFRISTGGPSTLQRLTGYSRRTELGRLVLMRTGARQRVPMDRICERWVDFFRMGGAGPASENGGGRTP